MNRRFTLSLVALLLAVAALLHSQAAPAPAPQVSPPTDYLLGAWDCAHTVGAFSGTYTTSFTRELGGRWLRQTYDFPPTVSGGRSEPEITAEALMGPAEGRPAWVRFFANSLGQHFAIRMTPTATGWTWKYVSYFPRKTPETETPDATFARKSDREFVIDGPTYPLDGVQVTEHHTCRKQ